MSAVYPLQPTFARGELSERLHVRADVEHWKAALAECFNFYVLRQGGVRRRPGTKFAGLARPQGISDQVRLVPFIFSSDQAYAIELSNLKARFYTNGGPVMSAGSPYEVTTPWLAADLAGLQFAQSADTVYVTHQGYAPRKILRKSETNWQIEIVDLQDGPYGSIVDVGTSMTPSSIGGLIPLMTSNTTPAGFVAANSASGTSAWRLFDRTKNGDQLELSTSSDTWWRIQLPTARICVGYALQNGSNTNTSPRTAPRAWIVEGSNDGSTWTTLDSRVGEIDWGPKERRYYRFENKTAYSYYRLIVDANNGDPADTSATKDRVALSEWSLMGGGADKTSVTLVANSTDGINGDTGFTAADIGRHIRLYGEDAFWHWAVITGVSNATTVTVRQETPPYASTKAFTTFRLGAFSEHSGYPRAVSFFQERLVYGGTPDQPQTVWASVSGDFDDFSTSIPLKADDSFQFTLADVSPISWIAEASDIVIGASSAIRTLGPADRSEGLSAVNVQQGKPVRAGTQPVQPALAGESAIFITRSRKSIRELVYSLDSNGYIAPDIGILSEHIFASMVKEIAPAPSPNAQVWFALLDGTLACMTYEREQSMVAITRHALGGPGAFVESIVSIPASDRHVVYMCVRRTRPDGSTMRTIEYLAPDFERANRADAYFVDCGLTYSGSPATVVGGLSHLTTFSCVGLADGRSLAPSAVYSGAWTLPDGVASSVIHVGFAYESRLRTLPLAQGLGDGSGLGRRKRVKKVIAHLLEAGQLKVRAGARSWQELVARRVPGGGLPPLTTRSAEIATDDQWQADGQVSMVVDTPQPCTILGVTPVYDMEP